MVKADCAADSLLPSRSFVVAGQAGARLAAELTVDTNDNDDDDNDDDDDDDDDDDTINYGDTDVGVCCSTTKVFQVVYMLQVQPARWSLVPRAGAVPSTQLFARGHGWAGVPQLVPKTLQDGTESVGTPQHAFSVDVTLLRYWAVVDSEGAWESFRLNRDPRL